MHYANDRRYMGWGNFFDPRNRSYFGLKFAYDTIPNELVPFDYDTFEAYPGQVEAVVTNLQTGRAEYREVPRRDASFLLLQATCAMPVLFQPIRLDDGAPYLDGGCSDAIPWKRALAVGCDRVVVVLTRERSYSKGPSSVQQRLLLLGSAYHPAHGVRPLPRWNGPQDLPRLPLMGRLHGEGEIQPAPIRHWPRPPTSAP